MKGVCMLNLFLRKEGVLLCPKYGQSPGAGPLTATGILTPTENAATPRRLLWVVACDLENAEIIVELNVE